MYKLYLYVFGRLANNQCFLTVEFPTDHCIVIGGADRKDSAQDSQQPKGTQGEATS